MTGGQGDRSIADVAAAFILQRFLPGEEASQLTSTTPLISTAILDSLAILELATFLEARYEILLEADDVNPHDFATLDAVERLVQRKLGQRG